MTSNDSPEHATAAALVRAMQTGDPTIIEPFLAEDVLWYGAGPGGGCRSRDDVLSTVRSHFEAGIRPRVHDVRQVGNRLLMHVGVAHEESGDEPEGIRWFVLTLDTSGRIAELQDYSSEAAAEHDLAIRATAANGNPGLPPSPVTGLVPFAHVADVGRSVAFYRLLGFEVNDTFAPDGTLHWAWLESEKAALMVARADAPIEPREQAVLFYLYAHDLAGLRDHLVAHGVTPGPGEIIDGSPGPRQEMRVTDPDGYCLMIAQIDDETGV